ncbi:hypothetical protein DC28_01485 [Spirochaeta lutea]|uniref:Metallo-beta-lactamase domain-containing protein n=2 Tax=Spirochaeta lutea TaxID=1480694 RepID=A0A098R1A8_9SPIO|nr:hypothetical protein DC28_01485 [Spirochaeta lutea]
MVIIGWLAAAGIAVIAFLGWIVIADRRFPKAMPDGIIPVTMDMTTSYLIPLPHGYLLVDTNYPHNYELFKELILQEGVDPKDIRFLLLTHHHDDHAGFVQILVSENPDIQVLIHERSIPLIARGRNNTDNGGAIVNGGVNLLFHLKKAVSPWWDHQFPGFIPRNRDRILRGAEVSLDAHLGIDTAVLSTPGHTDDSVSLLLENRYLFAGDLASNFLNWAGTRYLTIYNEDLAQVYESWVNILNRNVEVILPSHGRPFAPEALKKNLYKSPPENQILYKPY